VAVGGAAHLVNFWGTDTIAALLCLKYYYGKDEVPLPPDPSIMLPVAGLSIPAAEHSTITSWGRDGELEAFKNMLTQYPEGLVAVVSDSYDVFNACTKLWGQDLKDMIKNRKGCAASASAAARRAQLKTTARRAARAYAALPTERRTGGSAGGAPSRRGVVCACCVVRLRLDRTLVVRPDSGDPPVIVPQLLDLLGKAFAEDVTTTSTGHKMLPPYIRMIQVRRPRLVALISLAARLLCAAAGVAAGEYSALAAAASPLPRGRAASASFLTPNGARVRRT
jgi:hypothetical protein